jgi:hypothetical protein
MERTRKMLSALVASAVLLLVGAGGAQAKVFELTGSTTFTPSAQASQFLADHGVTVAPVGGATFENGAFGFPIVAGYGNPRTYNGLLAHSGGLQFAKGERSAVVRRFVAARFRDHAVLLAQIPALKGGCGHLRQALAHVPDRPVRQHPRAIRRVLAAVRSYCSHGKVIVLANLVNLSKEDPGTGVVLSADLTLGGQAARLLNRLAGERIVAAGAPLGSAQSTVTGVPTF